MFIDALRTFSETPGRRVDSEAPGATLCGLMVTHPTSDSLAALIDSLRHVIASKDSDLAVAATTVDSIKIVLPQETLRESQIVGVVAGALLTGLIAFIGSWWNARSTKERARLRLMSDLELQISHCDRLDDFLRDLQEVSIPVLTAVRSGLNPQDLREDLVLFSDDRIARLVHRWYGNLFLAVETTSATLYGARELVRRGGQLPATHPIAVEACRSFFQRHGRSGRRVHTLVWAVDRWWNKGWVRRFRRAFRRGKRGRGARS